MVVLEFDKMSDDGAKVLALIVQFEGIILHQNVKFRGKGVTRPFAKDIIDDR